MLVDAYLCCERESMAWQWAVSLDSWLWGDQLSWSLGWDDHFVLPRLPNCLKWQLIWVEMDPCPNLTQGLKRVRLSVSHYKSSPESPKYCILNPYNKLLCESWCRFSVSLAVIIWCSAGQLKLESAFPWYVSITSLIGPVKLVVKGRANLLQPALLRHAKKFGVFLSAISGRTVHFFGRVLALLS